MNDEQRRAELAHFLRSRRERLSPAQFHLPVGAKIRRTPGLRREELAQVAGVSTSWYMKLEQGQEIQVSAQVLESLAQALQLTSSEREHLYVLAREQLPLPPKHHTSRISKDLQETLDVLNPHPVMVLNERLDVVGWNRAASLVFADFDALPDGERNFVWIMLTQPDQRHLYADWHYWARQTVALFRTSTGRISGDSSFIELRDRLMQASSEFREWWSRHDIGEAPIVQKKLHHPLVGLLVLRTTPLLLAEDPNLKVFVFTPLPEADTAQKLLWLVHSAQTDHREIW